MRLCPEHALQLNYRKNKEALKAQRKAQKKAERKQQRRQDDSAADEELVSRAESSKRRKHEKNHDSEEHDAGGDASEKPSKHRLRSDAGRGAASHAGADAVAADKVAQGSHKEQGRSRVQRSMQHQNDEKGAGKPDMEEEADAFLREMFP